MSTERKLRDRDGLLAKWILLGAILRDPRCRDIHKSVAWPILNSYVEAHGNARAGVGYLARATGLCRGSVATATEDLVRWCYFTRDMGSGKRATQYSPNWQLAGVLYSQDELVLWPLDATSVLPLPDSLVLSPEDEIVLSSPDATPDGVLRSSDQTLLPHPLTSRVTVGGSDAGHAGAGLTAAPRPAPEERVEIVEAAVERDARSAWLELTFKVLDGENADSIFVHSIALESYDVDLQGDGQAEFGKLCAAIGMDQVETPEELLQRQLICTRLGTDLVYSDPS